MSDHPFDEVVEAVKYLLSRGVTIYQKFTCAKCGSRQTIDEPDTLYTSGICEECRHETDIVAQGCNYMAVASTPEAQAALFDYKANGLPGRTVH